MIRSLRDATKSSSIVWGHEFLSQPDCTLLFRISNIQQQNEISLVMARETDVVLLAKKPTYLFYEWLRDVGFSTDLVYNFESDEGTLTDLVKANHLDIRRYLREDSWIYVPRYCSNDDVEASKCLGMPLLGCDSHIVDMLYDKSRFKLMCKLEGINVVPGEVIVDQNTVMKYFCNSDKCIIKPLTASAGSGFLTVTSENIPNLPREQYLVEPLLKIKKEYSFQRVISHDGSIIESSNTQQTVNGFSHNGNRYLTSMPCKLKEEVDKTIKMVLDAGYIGVFGIDAFETVEGKVYISEMNSRLTGPTPATEVFAKIQQLHGEVPCLQYRKIQGKPKPFINLVDNPLVYNRNGAPFVFPINITSLESNGKFCAAIGASSHYEIEQIVKNLEEQ